MNNDKVLIIEWYKGGKLVRKTANGFDLPIGNPNGRIIIKSFVMKKKDFENFYGKTEIKRISGKSYKKGN